MPKHDRRLVYSTDPAQKIDAGLPKASRAKPGPGSSASVPDDGTIRVGCEKRRGGLLTLIYGLQGRELDTVANELKRRCGTGGTVKDGIVSLQGDKRTAALAYFAERGRRAKRMGG